MKASLDVVRQSRADVAVLNAWRHHRNIHDRAPASSTNAGSAQRLTASLKACGKAVRAEPISALYEQGKVHHVGYLRAVSDKAPGLLEDEMCGWVPGMLKSPNRLDALVWALTYLMLQPGSSGRPQFFSGTPRPKEFQLEPGWINKMF